MGWFCGSTIHSGETVARRQEAIVNARVERALRTASRPITYIGMWYALLLAILNFMMALGSRFSRFGSIATHAEHYTRLTTWQGPAYTPLLLGFVMLLLAYQLWLRKRAALIALSAFVIVQTLVDIRRGERLGVGIAIILFGLVLLSAWREFPAPLDTRASRRFKIACPIVIAAFFTWGITGLYIMRNGLGVAGATFYGFAYRSVTIAFGQSGLSFHGWEVLYRDGLALIALGGMAYLMYLLFRPYREEVVQTKEEHELAGETIRKYGRDSLAYFNMRKDKKLFWLGEDIFLAYRVEAGMAVVSGDPVGPMELVPDIIESFRQYCMDRGWRLMCLGAGDSMEYYEAGGMKGIQFGEETIIDIASFSLQGRQVRKLRQAVNKVEKAGVTMEFMYNASVPDHIKHQLKDISAEWRGGKQETGFSMGLGRLMDNEDPDCLLSIAYDSAQKPIAFMYFVPMYPHLGYSLDVHRSSLDAPNGISEFVIAKTCDFLREQGYLQLSLHFLALSQHYREDREADGSQGMRGLAKVLDKFLPVVSVYSFDKKFFPRWKARYFVYRSVLDYPLMIFAAVQAESALKVTRPADRRKMKRAS